jgi:two-component system cell cycle sensor histidine kinase/response regulator CckA
MEYKRISSGWGRTLHSVPCQGQPHMSVTFDAVILDLTVKGGMGGEETLKRLLEIDPGVLAVVSSGYSGNAVVANYREHGFATFLNKPYKLEALRDCLNF